MPRRLHVSHLASGSVELDSVQAHHAQRVLRLSDGDEVELFDDAGRTAAGRVRIAEDGSLQVEAGEVREPVGSFEVIVAAAVPKGDRADWMVEKLSELGCSAYVPLLTERSVVEPKGVSKIERWRRLATESAKQSRRAGVMRIDPPMALADALSARASSHGWFFDTGPATTPVRAMVSGASPSSLWLFIGPEGGWSQGEVDRLRNAGLQAVGLTDTVLRIETAAVVAASIVRAMWSAGSA
jgi:16S rRNA (uracil1498-N3)-methyltransferase